MLAPSTLYRERLSQLLRSCSTIPVFLLGMKDEVLRAQSLPIHRAIANQEAYWRAIVIYHIVLPSQPRIRVSVSLNSCSTPINHQIQILSLDRCWSRCWNESHHRESLCSFALFASSALVSSSLTHKHEQVSLLFQVRQACSQQGQGPYSALPCRLITPAWDLLHLSICWCY